MKSDIAFLKPVACALTAAGLLSVAVADDYAWETDGFQNFGKIDLSTGATNVIGTTQTSSSSSAVQLAGLGEVGNTVYGASYWMNPNTFASVSEQLYEINTSTGGLTAIGSGDSSLGIGAFGSTTAGLYGLGNDGDLYKFNALTGAVTQIGSGIGLANWGDTWNLSSGGSNLYFAYTSNGSQEIGQINTTTGVLTPLGGLTLSDGNYGFGGMTFVNGTFYGGGYFMPYGVYSINLGAGTASLVSQATNVNNFYGLAPAATPEPASLLGLAGCLGILLRRRKR